MKKFCIRAFIIFAAYFFYTENAIAGPFTHTKRSVKNMTETIVTIEGQVGETFDVRYTDATGRPKTKRVTTDLTGTGEVTVQPAKGTRVTIINKSQPVPNQTFIASLFEPPDKVVSDYVINTGSTIELGGNSFNLTGGFTTIDTDVDYDSLSPTFGIEEGFVSQLDISALGPAGLVNFDLSGTPTYTQNLGTIWDINIPLAGLSIPFTTNFSGTLEFNSVISPFTGIFDGTLTFFDDGSQAIEGALTFDTDFGTASGNLSANADPVLMSVPVPEASSSLGLLALGTLGTVPTLKRKLKSSRNHQ